MPSTSDVFPDLVFYLKTDTQTLLDRLEKDDPKFEFRRKNILENDSSFDRTLKLIPEEYKNRIIEIDASKSIEEIREQILNIIRPIN
jgi:thymidylate kinase